MLLGPAGEGPGPRRFSSLRGIVFAILLRGEGATLVIVLLRMPVPSLLRAEVPGIFPGGLPVEIWGLLGDCGTRIWLSKEALTILAAVSSKSLFFSLSHSFPSSHALSRIRAASILYHDVSELTQRHIASVGSSLTGWVFCSCSSAPDFDEEDLSRGSAVCGRDSLCCGAFSTQIDLAWPLNPEFAE
ncbi:hypothetical protein Bca101_087125 [Brassica carinata]